jgi:predicted kinase
MLWRSSAATRLRGHSGARGLVGGNQLRPSLSAACRWPTRAARHLRQVRAFPCGLVQNVAVNVSSDESTPLGSNFRDVLVVLAGLPGTGKTTIGRLLARRLRAAYLRTDVVAGPMLLEGLTEDSAEAGRVAYDIAREVATENLRAGVPVVVDGVHATHERRALWRGVSEAAQTRLVQLEMTLADEMEHRLRVQHRQARGYVGPTWEQILDMKYDEWVEAIDGPRLLVDTFETDAALACCLTHVASFDPA